MSTFAQHAVHGDWKSALRTAVVTGIVVTQASAWDRAFGSLFSYLFGSTEMTSEFAQALTMTTLGTTAIFVIHKILA